MNERIKELAEQATSIVESPKNSYGWGSSYAYFDKQKFAELIVKKCANIVWDEAEKTMSSEVNDAGYKIIEYFGVTESE
jgi:hypothetical protein